MAPKNDPKGPRRANDEGSIYRQDWTRSNGEIVERWIAQVRAGGTKHRTSHPTKAAAKRALKQMVRDVDDGLVLDHGNMTVADVLDMWATKALPNRNLAPSTVERHRFAILALTTYHRTPDATTRTPSPIARKKLRDLTPDDVEEYFQILAARGIAKATLVKMRSTLRIALAWAERRNYVGRNVATVVELPHDARPAESGRSMTADEARRFLSASEGTPFHAMFVVMLYLGLRPGEAAGLAWDDVDEDDATVHVHQARKIGTGGTVFVGEPKTRQSVRLLDAPPAVFEALRVHRRRQAEQRLAAGHRWSNRENLIFTNGTGGPLDPSRVRREFLAVVKAARLGPGWTATHLRHTAASLLSDAGVPLEIVADQLGHRDTRMASLHYRHRVRRSVDGGTVLGNVLGRTADDM